MRNLLIAAVVFALVAALVVGCGPAEEPDANGDETVAPTGTVTIGSKFDTEGPILGYIMIALLEDAGFDVVDRTRTGATDVTRRALLAGEIDAYPEYTANALTVFYADEDIDPAILRDAEATFEAAAVLDRENEDIVWLRPAPANNTWAIAIPRSFSEGSAIYSLEDLAVHVNGNGELRLAGSQEFFDRPDAMPAFEAAYGFELAPDQRVALATGDTAVTAKAAADGTDGVNAAMVYGTDGTIAALDLVVLADPLGVQPIYQPAPTFRAEVIDAFPQIPDILEPAFALLDLEALQRLNAEVALEGQDARDVAEAWLREVDLLY